MERNTKKGTVLHVLGADLMGGTPIYDIKPYVAYADSHEGVRSGFVDSNPIKRLRVEIPEGVARALATGGQRRCARPLSLTHAHTTSTTRRAFTACRLTVATFTSRLRVTL